MAIIQLKMRRSASLLEFTKSRTLLLNLIQAAFFNVGKTSLFDSKYQPLSIQRHLVPQMKHFVRWSSELLHLYHSSCKAWDPSKLRYRISTESLSHLSRLKEEHKSRIRLAEISVTLSATIAEKWGIMQALIGIWKYNNQGNPELYLLRILLGLGAWYKGNSLQWFEKGVETSLC